MNCNFVHFALVWIDYYYFAIDWRIRLNISFRQSSNGWIWGVFWICFWGLHVFRRRGDGTGGVTLFSFWCAKKKTRKITMHSYGTPIKRIFLMYAIIPIYVIYICFQYLLIWLNFAGDIQAGWKNVFWKFFSSIFWPES